MVRCFIGLGSNLEQPKRQILSAFSELDALECSSLVNKSSLYASKPLGPQDQPDYINAVAELETSLPALTLLASMQAIENEHQRVRKEHWGPRTLDLDLLLYGEEIISLPNLIVPHPELANRNFVVYPLYEIATDVLVPGLSAIQGLVSELDSSGLEKLQTNA